MSADIENALIAKIVETKDIRAAIKARLSEEYFEDDDCREAWNAVRNHYERHGTTPSFLVLRDLLPTFDPAETEDELSSLIERVRDRKLYNDLSKALEEIKIETRDSPSEGLKRMRQRAQELTQQVVSVDALDATGDAHEVVQWYDAVEKARANKTVVGVPYPWAYINEITLGKHPGEYIGFFAQPKSYKTWLLLEDAVVTHGAGYPVLFISQEMPKPQVQRRIIARYARVDWRAFRRGALSSLDKTRFRETARRLKNHPPFPIERLRSSGADCLTELRALLEQYRPRVVYIDGVYLLAERAEWQSMAEINRGLKQLAVDPRIGCTIVVTAQENNDGRISYKTFEQDLDVLFNVISTDEHKSRREVRLEAPFMREDEAKPILIHTLLAYNLAQKAIVSETNSGGGGLKGDDEPDNDIIGDKSPAGNKTRKVVLRRPPPLPVKTKFKLRRTP